MTDERRCPGYVGVTCVNGSCPNALADEYPEYGYEHCTCDECGYYKGCEDCALKGTSHCERGIMMTEREMLVSTARSFVGCSSPDEKVKTIYNNYLPHPRGYIVQSRDAWGCVFVSAVAISCNLSHRIPIECSCIHQVTAFKEMGLWKTKDSYEPLPGDYVYFSWDQTDFPVQAGIVEAIEGDLIKVIMGNVTITPGCPETIARKFFKLHSPFILGYGVPTYKEG